MTPPSVTSFLVPLIVLGIVGSALASCSSTSTSAGSTAAPSASGPSTAGPSTSSGADGLCALVSVSAANAAVKAEKPFTQQASGTFVDGQPECGYSAGDDLSFVVNVTRWDLTKTPKNLSGTAWVSAGAFTRTLSLAGAQAAVSALEVDVTRGTTGLSVETFGSTAASPDQLLALSKLFASEIP